MNSPNAEIDHIVLVHLPVEHITTRGYYVTAKLAGQLQQWRHHYVTHDNRLTTQWRHQRTGHSYVVYDRYCITTIRALKWVH